MNCMLGKALLKKTSTRGLPRVRREGWGAGALVSTWESSSNVSGHEESGTREKGFLLVYTWQPILQHLYAALHYFLYSSQTPYTLQYKCFCWFVVCWAVMKLGHCAAAFSETGADSSWCCRWHGGDKEIPCSIRSADHTLSLISL